MNKQSMLTILVFSFAAMVLWFSLDYGYSDNDPALGVADAKGVQTYVASSHSSTEQTQSTPNTATVEGLKGVYPRFIDNQSLLAGDANLPAPDADPQDLYDAKADAWAKVDFDALKQAMPNNMFWDMAMPTNDENVLALRAERREAIRAMETKIAARHAEEHEIRAYYNQQQTLSEDYVEAITLLLNKYGDVLPEDDYSGQTLARKMHLAKLQELPLQMTRALERRNDFLAERSEWLENRAEYEARLQAEAAQARKALGKI